MGAAVEVAVRSVCGERVAEVEVEVEEEEMVVVVVFGGGQWTSWRWCRWPGG